MKIRIVMLSLLAASLLSPAAHALKLNFDIDKIKETAGKLKALKEPSESDEIEIGKGVAANILGATRPNLPGCWRTRFRMWWKSTRSRPCARAPSPGWPAMPSAITPRRRARR